jgi:hypothetical protein
MRLCSKCGAEAADSHDTCGICGAPIDRAGSLVRPPELPIIMATLVESPFRRKPSPAPVGVPRRFSIGTMMILVTAFAMLFGVLKMFNVPPIAFAAISIFIGGVAACQSLLFQGKMPRLASFVGGIVMYGLIAAVTVVLAFFTYRGRFGIRDVWPTLFEVGTLGAFFAGPLGYCVGCFVAAIFLVRKEPDDVEPTADESARHSP